MLFKTVNDTAWLKSSWRWPHFSPEELSCRCTGRFCQAEYWHDPAFLDGLEDLRVQVGRPIVINSGHRCDMWNAAVGGAPLSMHKTIAVDLSLRHQDRTALKAAAIKAGFSGLGFARTFLHIDRRPTPARWFYKGARPSWEI